MPSCLLVHCCVVVLCCCFVLLFVLCCCFLLCCCVVLFLIQHHQLCTGNVIEACVSHGLPHKAGRCQWPALQFRAHNKAPLTKHRNAPNASRIWIQCNGCWTNRAAKFICVCRSKLHQTLLGLVLMIFNRRKKPDEQLLFINNCSFGRGRFASTMEKATARDRPLFVRLLLRPSCDSANVLDAVARIFAICATDIPVFIEARKSCNFCR